MKCFSLILAALVVLASGCAVQQQAYDYSAINAAKPRSILVIPPLSDATDVSSTYTFLATVSRPLAEQGYYVFPVAVVDQFLKENGLPTPGEMNAIPLDKARQVTGADAVLYVHILDWGQKYQVLSSVAVVDSEVKLVDTRNGALLWNARIQLQQKSGDSGGGIVGALVGAIADQIAGAIVDKTFGLSAQANSFAISNKLRGLPEGPYKKIE